MHVYRKSSMLNLSRLKTVLLIVIVLKAAKRVQKKHVENKIVFEDIIGNSPFWQQRYDCMNYVDKKIVYCDDKNYNLALDFRKNMQNETRNLLNYNETFVNNILNVSIKFSNNMDDFNTFIKKGKLKEYKYIKNKKNKNCTQFIIKENERNCAMLSKFICLFKEFLEKNDENFASKNNPDPPYCLKNTIKNENGHLSMDWTAFDEKEIVMVNWIIQFLTGYKIAHLLAFPLISIQKHNEYVKIYFIFDYNCKYVIDQSKDSHLMMKVKSIYDKNIGANPITYDGLRNVFAEINNNDFITQLQKDVGDPKFTVENAKYLVKNYLGLFRISISISSFFTYFTRNWLYHDQSYTKSKLFDFQELRTTINDLKVKQNLYLFNDMLELKHENHYFDPKEKDLNYLKEEITTEINSFNKTLEIYQRLIMVIEIERLFYKKLETNCYGHIVKKEAIKLQMSKKQNNILCSENFDYDKILQQFYLDFEKVQNQIMSMGQNENPIITFLDLIKNDNGSKFAGSFNDSKNYVENLAKNLKQKLDSDLHDDLIKRLENFKSEFANILNKDKPKIDRNVWKKFFEQNDVIEIFKNNYITIDKSMDVNNQNDMQNKEDNYERYMDAYKTVCYCNNLVFYFIDIAIVKLNKHGELMELFKKNL
ncbi:hypothetical protein COBT_002404 [Conglomerata obtusa]